MKQSKTTKVVALMLSLVMITSVFVGNTLSRYVTSVSSTDNARVAVWGINGKEVTMELFKTAYDLDGKKIAEANLNDDGITRDKIIAPGTGGSSAFSIINYENNEIPPEVAYQVNINLDDSAVDERIKNNTSIQWKLDNNSWGTWNEMVASVLLLSGNETGVNIYEAGTLADAFKDNVEHTISWQWVMDNGNNETDTNMGNDVLTGDISAKVTVSVTAIQVDDLVTNAYLIEGANQVVNLNYVRPLILRSSADFDTFESVEVNDVLLIRDTDYTAESGSTVITLNESYLKTLSVGTYTIDIVSSESIASTNFYVVNNLEDAMPMLAISDTWYKGSVARSSLKTINIVDEASEDIINNADESWPAAVDYAGDGELDDDIMCYIDGDVLTIAGNGSGKIYANYDSNYAFTDSANVDHFKNLVSFNGLDMLDVSETRTMGLMFNGMNSIKELDIGNWDISNVFNFRGMFQNNFLIESIDVSNWDTSNVTDMSYMFNGCRALTSIDVSNWDTSKVTDMMAMFNGGSSGLILPALDVSNWDTSNVTNMKIMFQNCKKLQALDVSNWDTSKVTDMSFMFYGLKAKTLDVSNWDTSKVTSFDHMFAWCDFLENLDVSKFDTSSATSLYAMFHSINNKVIDVSNFDTSNVTVFGQMFESCTLLEEIIGLENFDTSKGVDFAEMFHYCHKLKEVDLSSFDTRKAKNNVVVSGNGGKSLTLKDIFTDMRVVEKITLGENFSFNGDGSNTIEANKGLLPTPASGYWYTEDGTAYTAAEIQSMVNPAGTYYAVNPTLN